MTTLLYLIKFAQELTFLAKYVKRRNSGTGILYLCMAGMLQEIGNSCFIVHG